MNQNDSARPKWIKGFAQENNDWTTMQEIYKIDVKKHIMFQANNDNSNNQQYPKGFEKLQPRVI